MTAVITLPMLLYMAAMYCLRKGSNGRVVDALAVNWLINQVIVMGNQSYSDLPLFIAVDFVTSLWLMTRVGGKAARRAAIFFIPMIALNAAVYASAGPDPVWHYNLLFALAAVQLGVIGAMDDGFRKAVDSALCSILHPISGAVHYFRGRK
jgi:hypothetical protein